MSEAKLPHIGYLIEKVLKQKELSRIEVAGRMGVTPQTISYYLQQPTLNLRTLWSFLLALQYDLFGLLQEQYPQEITRLPDARITKLEKTVAEQKLRIEIYQDLLKK